MKKQDLEANFHSLLGNYSSDLNFITTNLTHLITAYSEKSRYYHNLEHITSMLSELEEVISDVSSPDTVLFSIYYHDIIYDPKRKDNEYQSACLCRKVLDATDFKESAVCFQQIIATKDHLLSTDSDTNILLDIDLSILGKEKRIYTEYSSQIRKEYAMYPDFLYKPGRKKALLHLLQSDFIYKTDYFRNKYEDQARKNLEDEIRSL